MRGRDAGQATVEWGALVALVALAFLAAFVAAAQVRPWSLGESVLHAIVCTVEQGCEDDADSLERAYGVDVAKAVRDYAPNVVYERRSAELPIDFRRRRATDCSNGPDVAAAVDRSSAGLPVAVFTRVIDHRSAGGPLYIQYWFYYPESFSGGIGRLLGPWQHKWPGYHADDFEGFQVRVTPSGIVSSRATAHGGYKNFKHSDGWGPYTGWYRVSGGSHAGHLVNGPTGERSTQSGDVTLIPIEALPDKDVYHFAISPPWQKAVYRDPESPSS